MSEWVRVFYRTGKSALFRRGPALDKALARKTPIIIHQEDAIIHRCHNCGAEGPFDKGWLSYPVMPSHPEQVRRRAGNLENYVVCSDVCWTVLLPGVSLATWIKIREERNRDEDRTRALYDALREERKRQSTVRDYRKVPMPVWRGVGFCKWCNLPMTDADKPARMWHRDCAQQYLLHTDLAVQTKFLHARDGHKCAVPGCENGGSDVDHKKPLWSVQNLPDLMRRPYYGPANLWILCIDHHQEKTKREAGLRAAIRRGSDI